VKVKEVNVQKAGAQCLAYGTCGLAIHYNHHDCCGMSYLPMKPEVILKPESMGLDSKCIYAFSTASEHVLG
jgi:hypothetical protein